MSRILLSIFDIMTKRNPHWSHW